METANYPEYASQSEDGVVVIDTDKAFINWFVRLKKVGDESNPKFEPVLDQYWLTVVRRCVTTEIRDIHGPGLHIRFKSTSTHDPEKGEERFEKYALANNPAGRGEGAGAAEFRRYYEAAK